MRRTKRFTLAIDPILLDEFRRYSDRKNEAMSRIIARWIRAALKRESESAAAPTAAGR